MSIREELTERITGILEDSWDSGYDVIAGQIVDLLEISPERSYITDEDLTRIRIQHAEVMDQVIEVTRARASGDLPSMFKAELRLDVASSVFKSTLDGMKVDSDE